MTSDIRAAERAADRLARMLAALKTVNPKFHIPTLEEDPDGDDPTNIWLLEDGRLRVKGADATIFEYVPVDQARPAVPTFTSDPAVGTGWKLWYRGDTGAVKGRLADNTIITISTPGGTSTAGGEPASGSGTSSKAKPADPKPRTHRTTYDATWAMSYCSEHGQESGSELHYGDLGYGYHGERRIMIGFDESDIQSDLTGATVKQIELRVQNTDAWAHGGIRIHWGGHKKSSAPASFSAVRRNVWSGEWPESGYGTAWRKIHLWFAKALKADVIRGLCIDQGSGKTQYGAISWDTARLKVTYTKPV